MKKVIMFTTVLGAALAINAASLDWTYAATKSDVGQTVYVLLGSEAKQDWADAAAVKNAAVSSDAVAKRGVKYTASGSFTSDKVTKTSADVYYVIISADESSYAVTSVASMTDSVYGTTAQESTPGANSSLSSSSITKSGIAWGTGGGDNPPGPDDPPGPGPDDPPTPGPGPGGDGDVPEPTSGLLLMIGGAALALRRRR